jgi:hypothetical protein
LNTINGLFKKQQFGMKLSNAKVLKEDANSIRSDQQLWGKS